MLSEVNVFGLKSRHVSHPLLVDWSRPPREPRVPAVSRQSAAGDLQKKTYRDSPRSCGGTPSGGLRFMEGAWEPGFKLSVANPLLATLRACHVLYAMHVYMNTRDVY